MTDIGRMFDGFNQAAQGLRDNIKTERALNNDEANRQLQAASLGVQIQRLNNEEMAKERQGFATDLAAEMKIVDAIVSKRGREAAAKYVDNLKSSPMGLQVMALRAQAAGMKSVTPEGLFDMFVRKIEAGATSEEEGAAEGAKLAGKAKGIATATGQTPAAAEEALNIRPKQETEVVSPRDAQGNKVTQLIDKKTGTVIKELGRGPDVTYQPPTTPTKPEHKEYRDAEIAARTALGELGRLKEQLAEAKTFTGLVGTGVQFAGGVAGTMKQAALALGMDDQPLLDPKQYQFGKFGEGSAKTAAFQSNVTNLGYAMARAANGGGNLSARDVQMQIDRLAASSGDKDQMSAAIAEVERGIKSGFRIRHQVLSRAAPEIGALPQEFADTPAPATTATPQMPAGVPQGSTQIGTRGGVPVYQTPDGRRVMVQP